MVGALALGLFLFRRVLVDWLSSSQVGFGHAGDRAQEGRPEGGCAPAGGAAGGGAKGPRRPRLAQRRAAGGGAADSFVISTGRLHFVAIRSARGRPGAV